MILPALTLALPAAAVYQRLLRTDLITHAPGGLHPDGAQQGRVAPVGALQARPATLVVLVHHRVRDHTGALIGGALVVEQIFLIPGLGSAVVEAVAREDFPVVLAIVMLVAVTFVVINLVVDIIYTIIDPRVHAMTRADRPPSITESPMAVTAGRGRRRRRDARAGSGPVFWIAVGWMVLIVLAAILAPWLPLKDPEQNYIDRSLGRPPYSPSSEFWFGTDNDARDMFSRTIWGARVSLTVGFVAIAFGMLIGGSLGNARRLLPRLVGSRGLVRVRGAAVVPGAGAGDPDHHTDRSQPVHDLGHARFPGDRAGRDGSRGPRRSSSASASSWSPPARSGPRTGASSCANCCPTWSSRWARWRCSAWRVAIVAEGALAFLGLSVEKGSRGAS